jgi:hypothetical protein
VAIDARKHGGAVSVRIDLRLDSAPGRSLPVEVTMTPQGLTLRGIGRRLGLYIDWPAVIRRMSVPPEAPAKFLCDPAGLLGPGK